MESKKPNIFNPKVASFLSPKPKYFFTIGLASYINFTPIASAIVPINSKNTLKIQHPLFLKF